jgi:hypothetical protein
MSDEEPIVLVFIPALVALLHNAEMGKGSPLTEDEVIAIRDQGVCMSMAASQAAALETSRGYPDLDPENAWAEWQIVREQLGEDEAG